MNNFIFAEPSNEWPITFLASFLIWIMFGGLFFLWAFAGKIKKEVALKALMAGIIAGILGEVIKNIIPTLRPFKINGYPPLTITIPGSYSFPSSHTAEAFAMAAVIWFNNKKVGFIFILAAIAVATGRILANVHFFVDILGGTILGIGVSLLQSLYSIKLHLFKKK